MNDIASDNHGDHHIDNDGEGAAGPACAGCSRRRFLEQMTGIAVGALALRQLGCGPAGGSGSANVSGNSMTLDLSQSSNAPLAAVGGSVLVDAPSDTIIVIRTAQSSVSALSAVCTHAGCLVGFDGQRKVLQCPCHGSMFSESGVVLGGPAPLPLRSYPATLADNQVTISLG